MDAIFEDLQALENPLNGSRVNSTVVKELLSTSEARAPFLFELRGDNGVMLTVGLAGRVGVAQYASAVGLPPYLMALADDPSAELGFVEFLARDTPTRILRRYCLAVERLEEVVGKFLEDGTRLEHVPWEEI